MTALPRQLLAELLGSAGLVAAVVGSGIAAERLSTDPGLRLLENALATGGALVVLILVFGPVSGAHLNPAITLADWWTGGLPGRAVPAYVVAQLVGGGLGAVAANLMFGLDAVTLADQERSGAGLWLAEVLATFGLVLLVLALSRTGRTALAPAAVGAYIAAAYWWSSSTSFANPMIDLARTLSDTFAGIDPASVPMFVVAQLVGTVLAVPAAAMLYPDGPGPAAEVVVPHPDAEESR